MVRMRRFILGMALLVAMAGCIGQRDSAGPDPGTPPPGFIEAQDWRANGTTLAENGGAILLEVASDEAASVKVKINVESFPLADGLDDVEGDWRNLCYFASVTGTVIPFSQSADLLGTYVRDSALEEDGRVAWNPQSFDVVHTIFTGKFQPGASHWLLLAFPDVEDWASMGGLLEAWLEPNGPVYVRQADTRPVASCTADIADTTGGSLTITRSATQAQDVHLAGEASGAGFAGFVLASDRAHSYALSIDGAEVLAGSNGTDPTPFVPTGTFGFSSGVAAFDGAAGWDLALAQFGSTNVRRFDAFSVSGLEWPVVADLLTCEVEEPARSCAAKVVT